MMNTRIPEAGGALGQAIAEELGDLRAEATAQNAETQRLMLGLIDAVTANTRSVEAALTKCQHVLARP
jgi:hypothetical protein